MLYSSRTYTLAQAQEARETDEESRGGNVSWQKEEEEKKEAVTEDENAEQRQTESDTVCVKRETVKEVEEVKIEEAGGEDMSDLQTWKAWENNQAIGGERGQGEANRAEKRSGCDVDRNVAVASSAGTGTIECSRRAVQTYFRHVEDQLSAFKKRLMDCIHRAESEKLGALRMQMRGIRASAQKALSLRAGVNEKYETRNEVWLVQNECSIIDDIKAQIRKARNISDCVGDADVLLDADLQVPVDVVERLQNRPQRTEDRMADSSFSSSSSSSSQSSLSSSFSSSHSSTSTLHPKRCATP